jgi:putative aldouronate transport system permease protein
MSNSLKKQKKASSKINNLGKQIWKYKALYLMLVLPFLQLILFKYKPMLGTVVAFKKYNIFKGMWDSPWVGFTYFKEAFASTTFWTAVKNTLVLNIGDLIVGFPIPIFLAILLYEVNSKKVRSITQLVTYLPHFLSWVIIGGIITQVFSSAGMVNTVLKNLGFSQIDFLSNPQSWRIVYWISGIWQGAGYSLIIYLAALTGVDTSLYEASYLDGAGRWRRIWHITIPQIRPTITTMLIMSLGKVMAISFDRPYMLGNALVKDTSEVISTYVYSVGLGAGRFDFAAAIGLFQSVIGVVMILSVNKIVKKLGEEGIL